MIYFWLNYPNLDKYIDILCYTVNSIFMTGFCDSVCIFCIVEIIGPYIKQKITENWKNLEILNSDWPIYRFTDIFPDV